MKNKPNNFPVEGANNTITKDGLEKLEADRPKHNAHLDYTIGGMRETIVHTNVEASRNYALNAGHRRMNELSEKVQTDHVFAANSGRAKAQFQASNDTSPTYAEMQRLMVQKNEPLIAAQRQQNDTLPYAEQQKVAAAPAPAPEPQQQLEQAAPTTSYADQQRSTPAPAPSQMQNNEPSR